MMPRIATLHHPLSSPRAGGLARSTIIEQEHIRERVDPEPDLPGVF
jgi:hypothetical protein